jgi:hypothetical protein
MVSFRHASLAVFLLLFTQQASAGESPVVPFFRTQQSQFPSGQISRSILENSLLRQEQKPWYRVHWNKHDYEVAGDFMIKDVQVTQTLLNNEPLTLLKSPIVGAAKALSLPAKTTLVVLKTDESWAELLEPKLKVKGWARLVDLSAPIEDKGVYVTVTDTFLRKAATGPGPALAVIPRHQRLTALSIEKSYLKVRYAGQIGYVDLSTLVGRGDFAMWAYHQTKGWLGISYRENGSLMTVQNERFPLDEFLAFSTYADRGVITKKVDATGPSVRSRVEITNNGAHIWNLSLLDGHGPVWWQSGSSESAKSNAAIQNGLQITTEALLKREVHSVAFASSKSLKGLASAGGIFRTEDGKNWTQLPMFEDKNYPVSIHPEGVWFVGSYRSFDEGKTFEPYIKWDRLAEQIQSSIHKAPRHLRITEIEPLAHSRVRILVDTGVQKLKMQAHFLSHEWVIVK